MSVAVAVAIHVASELSPDLAERTVKSCLAALGPERCRLADEPPTDDAFYATVSTEDGDAVAHIRLLRHGADTTPLVERELTFAPEDATGDRWASVGVVIAALVTAASGSVPAPPPPPPKPPAPVRRRPPKAAPAPARASEHQLRFDVLAQWSRETATAYPAELGVVVRGAFSPGRSPLFATLTAGYAERLAPQPELVIPSASLGGGFRSGAPQARWGAEVHAAGRVERWILSASEPGRTDSEGVWRFGGDLGVDATWGFTRRFQVVAGVSGDLLFPRVSVDVRRQNTEKVPLVGAGFALGVRFVP
jgi:hypothetical protein